MALSAFDDKTAPPEPAGLRKVLGASASLWDEIVGHVAGAHAPITEEWSFAGAKFGWSLRLRRKDRVVLYLTPQRGKILAGVVLGEKAAKAAPAAGVSAAALRLIDEAPRYAEGRGIRLPVVTRDDVLTVQQLVALKMGP